MNQQAVCILCLLFHVHSYEVEVNVKQGKVLGISLKTIFDGRIYYAFYGIPYARRPTGKLRFKDPRAPIKWDNHFDARTEFYGACAQSHVVRKHGLYGNEDCLRLNIFSPSRPKASVTQKTVIVWVHGFAYTSSFSHIYGPDFFIDNDVIFVTVTHRIGAFGFLKLNESDTHANMGLKDIVIALKWIKKNISQFGGNNNNVVVMGSGSGATYISLLLTTKYNKLFAKVILQSGSMFSPSLFQGDHKLEKNILESKLKVKGFKNILEAPAKEIVEVSKQIYNSIDIINTQRNLIPFLPIFEIQSKKCLLTSLPSEYVIAPDAITKPILIGFNSQEGITEVIPFLHNPSYLKSYSTNFKFMVPFQKGCKLRHNSQIYNVVAEYIKNGYFKEGISEKSSVNFLRYMSDLNKYPTYDFIQRVLKLNYSKMFVYKFSYNGNLNVVKASATLGLRTKVRGAASGDEICYLLRCEPIWENYLKINRENTKERSYIKHITELWANFAKFAEPTPTTYIGNVTWPATTIENGYSLHLGKVIHLSDMASEKKMYKFWNDIYRKYYENCHKHEEL